MLVPTLSTGQLLLGLVRIYQRKVAYLQQDAEDYLVKMRGAVKAAAAQNAETAAEAEAQAGGAAAARGKAAAGGSDQKQPPGRRGRHHVDEYDAVVDVDELLQVQASLNTLADVLPVATQQRINLTVDYGAAPGSSGGAIAALAGSHHLLSASASAGMGHGETFEVPPDTFPFDLDEIEVAALMNPQATDGGGAGGAAGPSKAGAGRMGTLPLVSNLAAANAAMGSGAHDVGAGLPAAKRTRGGGAATYQDSPMEEYQPALPPAGPEEEGYDHEQRRYDDEEEEDHQPQQHYSSYGGGDSQATGADSRGDGRVRRLFGDAGAGPSSAARAASEEPPPQQVQEGEDGRPAKRARRQAPPGLPASPAAHRRAGRLRLLDLSADGSEAINLHNKDIRALLSDRTPLLDARRLARRQLLPPSAAHKPGDGERCVTVGEGLGVLAKQLPAHFAPQLRQLFARALSAAPAGDGAAAAARGGAAAARGRRGVNGVLAAAAAGGGGDGGAAPTTPPGPQAHDDQYYGDDMTPGSGAHSTHDYEDYCGGGGGGDDGGGSQPSGSDFGGRAQPPLSSPLQTPTTTPSRKGASGVANNHQLGGLAVDDGHVLSVDRGNNNWPAGPDEIEDDDEEEARRRTPGAAGSKGKAHAGSADGDVPADGFTARTVATLSRIQALVGVGPKSPMKATSSSSAARLPVATSDTLITRASSRMDASRTFFELLVLHNRGFVKLEQPAAKAPVVINLQPPACTATPV